MLHNCSHIQVLTSTNPDYLYDHGPVLTTVAFSPNQQSVAAGFDDTTICIWDARTGTLVERLCHQNPVYSIVFLPDGKRLVSSDIRGTVKFWDVDKLLDGSNGENNDDNEHAQSGISKASGKTEREEEHNNCYTMTCAVHGVSSTVASCGPS